MFVDEQLLPGWAGLTDRGRVRKNNEDALSIATVLTDGGATIEENAGECTTLSPSGMMFTVSDGVGGGNAGEVASQLAVERLPSILSALLSPANERSEKDDCRLLEQALRQTNSLIREQAASGLHLQGMAATVSSVWFAGSRAIIGQIGDSRVYRYRDGNLEQLTRDHTLIGGLVEAGNLSESEAKFAAGKNVIDQALGMRDEALAPDVTSTGIKAGDLLLLCSDGLVDRLENQHIEDFLRSCRGDGLSLSDTTAELIERANSASGRDNVTVLLVTFGAKPTGSELTQTGSLASG